MEILVRITNGLKDVNIGITITRNDQGLVELYISEGHSIPAGRNAFYRIPEAPRGGQNP